MRFQVPKFIEIEDTIFGPLTFKQFLYLGGAGGASFLLYTFLPFWAALVPIILVIALGVALAFYKINERPFVSVIESAFYYFTKPKLYIWQKKNDPPSKEKKPPENKDKVNEKQTNKITEDRLKDLAWSLDVKDKIE